MRREKQPPQGLRSLCSLTISAHQGPGRADICIAPGKQRRPSRKRTSCPLAWRCWEWLGKCAFYGADLLRCLGNRLSPGVVVWTCSKLSAHQRFEFAFCFLLLAAGVNRLFYSSTKTGTISPPPRIHLAISSIVKLFFYTKAFERCKAGYYLKASWTRCSWGHWRSATFPSNF